MQEAIVLPSDHFRKRVQSQYNNVSLAIVREIVQNSQDAGAKRVEFAFSDNGYTASDNGCGMDLEKARRVFLTLGGSQKANYCPLCDNFTGSTSCCGNPTHKPTGGFGAAKEVLLFAWDSWEFQGQGFAMRGKGASNPESGNGGIKRGFQIGASGDGLDGPALSNQLHLLCGLSGLRIAVYDESGKVPTGRTLRRNQVVKKFDFGTLYVHKACHLKDWEKPGYLYIRTNGLFTCQERAAGPFVYYLDLSADSHDVLTENRDALRWEISREIAQVLEVELLRYLSGESDAGKPALTLYGVEKTHARCPALDTAGDYVPDGAAVSVAYAPVSVRGFVHIAEIREGNSGAIQDIPETFGAIPDTNFSATPATLDEIPGAVSVPDSQAFVPLAWRAPFAIYAENSKPKVESKEQGTLKAKFNKALEIWSACLNMVADCAELDKPIPGLCFSDMAEGVHIEQDSCHVVCGTADVILKDNPFAIMELAIHEIAHYGEANHSAPYESARFAIARKVGSAAPAILATIANLQAKPAARGRYWEK